MKADIVSRNVQVGVAENLNAYIVLEDVVELHAFNQFVGGHVGESDALHQSTEVPLASVPVLHEPRHGCFEHLIFTLKGTNFDFRNLKSVLYEQKREKTRSNLSKLLDGGAHTVNAKIIQRMYLRLKIFVVEKSVIYLHVCHFATKPENIVLQTMM